MSFLARDREFQVPLRVLQVVTTMNQGGLESMLMNYYRAMDRDIVQFDFLKHRPGESYFDKEIKALGGRIFYAPRANPLSLKYMRFIKQFFLSHPEYSVVHSHINCMSSLPLRAAQQSGVGLRIAHAHSANQTKDIRYPIKIACRNMIPRYANKLLACSEKAGAWMFGGTEFGILNNAIDANNYAFSLATRERVRNALGVEPDTLLVGHVGRFEPVKNHHLLLQISQCMTREPDRKVMFVLVGEGPLTAEMQEAAKGMGIQGSVKFLGSRSDVGDIMSALDVFVLPSFYEGLPLVLVEAQASGLPCVISSEVATDCDFEGSSIERLSPYADPREWAASIKQIAILGNRFSGGANVKKAGYDIADQADKLASFYLSGVRG